MANVREYPVSLEGGIQWTASRSLYTFSLSSFLIANASPDQANGNSNDSDEERKYQKATDVLSEERIAEIHALADRIVTKLETDLHAVRSPAAAVWYISTENVEDKRSVYFHLTQFLGELGMYRTHNIPNTTAPTPL